MNDFVAHLFAHRYGFQTWPQGWARFRRGRLVDASPAVANAYGLMAAHFDQIGF